MFRNTLDKMLDIRDAKRAERQDGEAGFTLIELLVVVVIIGILIAIAIPLYLNYTQGAKNKGAESDVRAAVAAVQQCYTDGNNAFPASGAQSATTGGTFNFTMPTGSTPATCATTATVSDGTTMTYALVTGGYKLTASTTGGATYTFDSTVGKVVKTA